MANSSRGRGIRGTAGDLKATPGEHMLDRLVDGNLNGTVAKSPNPSTDIATPSTNGKPALTDEKIKVAFYLEPEQRRRLDLLLAHARPLVGKLAGRRLDQSA